MITEIHNREELNRAFERLDELWDTCANTSCDPNQDEFHQLTDLIGAYEDEWVYMLPPTPADSLRYCLERLDLQPAALEPYFGSAERVDAVLAGTLAIEEEIAQRLHDDLGCRLDTLLGRSTCPCYQCRTGEPIPPDK